MKTFNRVIDLVRRFNIMIVVLGIILVAIAIVHPEYALLFAPVVGMALDRVRTRINVKGAGKVQIRELSPTASDAFLDLGYLSEVSLVDEHTMVDSPAADGNFIDTKSGARKVTLRVVMKQSSKDEIDLLRNAAGKYYDVYMPVTLANASFQEYSIPLAKLKPGATLNFQSATERTIELFVTGLAPEGAFTETPTSFNVVANEPLIIVEGASQVGPPTGTAATKATAIL